MDFRTSLDRWLTTDPNAEKDSWYEGVNDCFTSGFWMEHEKELEDMTNLRILDLMDRLYAKGTNFVIAARIIERIIK
ncbi:MAG: hypothetical protein WCL06_00040 [Bacteroidota bacterium]